MEKIVNFRDIGGLVTREGRTVRPGALFRSGHLADATDADLAELQRRGIRTVVDLRGPSDIRSDGENRMPAGANYVSIPMFEQQGTDIRSVFESGNAEALFELFGDGRALQLMVRGAADMVTSADRCADFGEVVKTIANQGATPALIHCSAGKDRTGWAASLILTALGVDEAAVTAHYLESNERRRAENEAQLNRLSRAGIDSSLLAPLVLVHAECVQASLRAVDEHWGGIDSYLYDGLGLDKSHVDHLRATLLV